MKKTIWCFVVGGYFGFMLWIMGYDVLTWQYYATIIPVTAGLLYIGNMRDK